MIRSTVFLLALLALPLSATATPLRLDYTVSPTGTQGVYYYEFEMTLDNSDNTWTPGDQWGWIVFGDVLGPVATSPLNDFLFDASTLPAGPWTDFGISSGMNNGPTLSPVDDLWTPSSVGDSVSWAGWSHTNMPTGLLWSSLSTQPTDKRFEFEPTNLPRVPEPASWLLLISGTAALFTYRRRDW